MFCVQCGKEIPEGASVCPGCGAKAEKEISFSDVTNYAGKKAQQMSEGLQNQVQNFRQTQAEAEESRKVKDVSELFVDEQEEQKAVIGGGYLNNMLHSGVFLFAVVMVSSYNRPLFVLLLGVFIIAAVLFSLLFVLTKKTI